MILIFWFVVVYGKLRSARKREYDNAYIARKTYNYLNGFATVMLYVYVNYPVSREVTFAKADEHFEADLATVTLKDPVISVPTAKDPKCAECYVKGTFSVNNSLTGNVHSESIKVTCKADQAGLFYVS